jgi:hypothetical protein
LGLRRGWFDLLAALRRAGAPYELNPTQLMKATLLSSGGMTKRLDRLMLPFDLTASAPEDNLRTDHLCED